MKRAKRISVLVVILLASFFCSIAKVDIATASSKEVKVLLVAISGINDGFKEWQPTIDYIQDRLPELKFSLIPVIPKDLDHIKDLIKRGEIDFVITQPAIYVDLEMSLGVSKVLTLEKMEGIAEFGSVLLTKQDSDIASLLDIKNKRVAGVAILGFGGWLIGYHEMLKSGVDPFVEAGEVIFLGTQTKVLDAVLRGEVDLGVVRTGILEKVISKNRLKLTDVRIINEKQYDNFPLKVSTRLFPEWSLARTKKVTNNFANKVVKVLLSMPAGGKVAQLGRYWQWTTPYDYQPVHDVLKSLQVGPYKDFGKITLPKFLAQHKMVFSVVVILSVVILLMAIVIYRSNRLLLIENKHKVQALSVMEQMALYDDLTQLPNRRLFFELLLKILQKAQRDQSKFSILYMDLDGFKHINDTFGHDIGDKVLIKAAETLKNCIRESDVVARLGGDEFISALVEVGSRENAETIVNRIISQIPLVVDNLNVENNFGISVGCLVCGPNQSNIDEIMVLSDELMYEAKAAGKGCYVVKDLSE